MPVLQIASHLLHGRLPSQAMHHDISSPARITAVSSPELPSPCSSRQQPCSNSKFWHKISSPSPIFAYYPGAVEHVRSIVRIKPLVADHPRGIHPPPLQLGSSQGGVLVAAAGGYPRFFLTMQRLRRFIARGDSPCKFGPSSRCPPFLLHQHPNPNPIRFSPAGRLDAR